MYHNAGPAPLYLKDCVDVKRREMFVHGDSISLLLTSKTNAFRNAPAECPAFMIHTPGTHFIQTGRKAPAGQKQVVGSGLPQASILMRRRKIDHFRLRKNKFPDWISYKQNIPWERSEKHLFWMLGGGKWSPVGRTFGSGVTSIQIFEVERNGFCVMISSPGTDLLLKNTEES